MCYGCENIVATAYDDRIYQPLSPLQRTWNLENIDNYIKIGNNLYFVICNDKKNYSIAKILNFIATQEETSFLNFKEEFHKIILIYNNSQAIGYIMWSENEKKLF